MKWFVNSVCQLVDESETFVMATVVESSGSTPRSSGAKMAIRRDGSIFGTVGGGLVEAMACKDGLKMLSSVDGTAKLSFTDMTQEMAADSDMICGGGLSMLLEVVDPAGPCAGAYKELNDLLRRGVRSVLSTHLEIIDILCAVRHEITPAVLESDPIHFKNEETSMLLVETFIPPPPLYIFGAGHVSLFTARVGTMVGFRTVVLDDRDNFANVARFPDADEVIVLSSFDGCCDSLDIGDDAFIIIVTRGHLHDRNVLAETLKTNARYIGMIGSTKKRDKIYESLLADGVTKQNIDRCHCPIGLSIGGQTPEEIAVSIGAELIQIRSGHTA